MSKTRARNRLARLCFQAPQAHRAHTNLVQNQTCDFLSVCFRGNFSQTKLLHKTSPESQTTPIQPT
ncbi:MAG TPA: hypothetical protein DHW63_06300 [Hyphomonadaceae bacterium]|nr:hypothetical protein [Hyphomonadaceae bacterium]